MGGMRMKVLHIGEYVQGGVATYIKTLLMHPQHPEIEDFLICSDKNSEHHWPMAEDHVTYYPYHRSLLQILPAMLAVRKEIRRRKPDVVYCHSTWAGLFARFPMLFLGKPCRVIYNAHGWAFLRNTAEWKKKIYAFMECCLLHATDAVINVSNYEYQAALNYGLPEAKMKVIYSGISGRKGVIDESLKLPEGCINLLFVGRFDPQKGVDYLLEQLSQCHRDDLHLTVIGDNVIGGTQIEKHNTEKVTFLGWIDHEKLASYYEKCDAVVMPSRWEAFGLVAVEAMKYGKAVIASDRGALPELVENGENGYIFPFDSPDTLIHLLSGLDKEKLADMGRKAEKIFQKKYQMERMIEESVRLYEGKDKK